MLLFFLFDALILLLQLILALSSNLNDPVEKVVDFGIDILLRLLHQVHLFLNFSLLALNLLSELLPQFFKQPKLVVDLRV